MDVAALREQLFDAHRRVGQCSKRITRQEGIIARRDRSGRDTTASKKLLTVLRQTYLLSVEDRDRALANLTGKLR